jgi:hypothetical protein
MLGKLMEIGQMRGLAQAVETKSFDASGGSLIILADGFLNIERAARGRTCYGMANEFPEDQGR